MKCRLCSSENTDRTYSPGLPWLSLTRKSPCCRSNSWASVRGMAPWYHSCSASGRSDVGMTSKNCCSVEHESSHIPVWTVNNFTDWSWLRSAWWRHTSDAPPPVGVNKCQLTPHETNNDSYRSGGAQHGFRRPDHSSQRVAQSFEARAPLLRFILETNTHTCKTSAAPFILKLGVL